jgi:type I restriction enzyme S subunit
MKYHATYSRFKESNVAWLGEIPKHWSVTRFKYLFDLNPTKSAVANRRYALCSFLPMEKLKTDTIVLDEIRVVDEVYEGYSYFSDGDILIAKVTPCFENRNIAVAADLTNRIGFGSTEINVIRAKSSINTRFLYYRLQEDQFRRIAISESFQGGIERVKARGCVRSSYVVLKASDEADVDYFAYLFKSSAYIQGLQATSSFIRDGQDLNYGNFRQVKLPKPPLEEQKRIAQYLNQQTARIDALIEKTQHSVALLTERRAAFITAAVTGQIDLRGEE